MIRIYQTMKASFTRLTMMNLFVFTPISRIDCKCEFSIKTFFHFSILAFGLMDAEESHSEALRFFGNLIIIATKNFTLLGLMLIGSLYDRLHEDDLQLSPAIIFICFGIISGICIFQVLLQAVYYSNDFVFTKVWRISIGDTITFVSGFSGPPKFFKFSLSLILELISFHIYQILL